MIAMIISAVVAAVQGIGGPSEEQTADIECVYEYRTSDDKGREDVYSTILQVGKRSAKFVDYSTFQLDSARASGASEEQVEAFRLREEKKEQYFEYAIFQNEPAGNMTVYGTIIPDRYSYTEDSKAMKWTLADDEKTICGYQCHKAECEYGGRKWTAWYSQDIPVSYGPWKLCGLPGLILAAEDSDGANKFEAIILRNGASAITPVSDKNITTTTREKFVKAKNMFESDPMGNLPPESISEMSIHKYDDGSRSIHINGVQLRLRTNGYVPLELK